jgi:hypothetical protein
MTSERHVIGMTLPALALPVAVLLAIASPRHAAADAVGPTADEIQRMRTAMDRDAALAAALEGHWGRSLPNGEGETLVLFNSSVMALHHYDAKLPMYRIVGNWFVRDAGLDVDFASCEPDSGCPKSSFTGRRTITVSPDRKTLTLEHAGQRSTWKRVQHPYGTAPGVEQRAERDHRSWTFMFGIALGKSERCTGK